MEGEDSIAFIDGEVNANELLMQSQIDGVTETRINGKRRKQENERRKEGKINVG